VAIYEDTVNRTVKAMIRGQVQGVGYRDWAQRNAVAMGLRGYVRNRRDGSVELVLCGPDEQVGCMLELCRKGPRLALVSSVETATSDWTGDSFQVLSTI
jgi:acylphosphatase